MGLPILSAVTDGQVVDDFNIGDAFDDGARNFINSCLFPKHSMDNLARLLKPNTKILHSEPIARPHLIARFEAKREWLRRLAVQETRSKGRRAMDKRVDDLTRIEIVFHGTPRRNIDAIVRGGFAIPGTGKTNVNGEQVVVRCGSTWGRGVYVANLEHYFVLSLASFPRYSSPDPSYCLSYGDYTSATLPGQSSSSWSQARPLLPGQKIFVCAVLMGRRRHLSCHGFFNRLENAGPLFDSHVSPGGREWIVFDPAQIVPLLVLHMGSQQDSDSLKSLVTRKVETRGRDEGEDSSGKALRLTALARKSLPYGFGPAGSGFVVEEIGEVSVYNFCICGDGSHLLVRSTRTTTSTASIEPRRSVGSMHSA